jgi:hypothetical protein
MSAINAGQDDGEYFDFEVNVLRKKKQEAQLCFLSMNLVTPPDGAFWGKFNDRVLVDSWVDDLVNVFKGGLDHTADENAINVAVKREWVEGLDKENIDGFLKANAHSEGKDIEEVPEVKFTPLGLKEIKNRNLWMLGGNHRREAMKIIAEGLSKEIEEERKVLAKLKRENQEGDEVGIKNAEISATEEKLQKLEQKLSKMSKWAVRLFDRGEQRGGSAGAAEEEDAYLFERAGHIEKNCDEDMVKAVFRLLSRNETRATQKATEEEHLQEVVDSLKDALEKDLRVLKERNRDEDYEVIYPQFMEAVGKKAEKYKSTTQGYCQLCSLPRFALALVMASRVWRHYRHAVWFRMAPLKSMVEVHGGVSADWREKDGTDETMPAVHRGVPDRERGVPGADRERERAAASAEGDRGHASEHVQGGRRPE